jgi:lipoprotein-anchoring transpeptidase ErfK/SrfK
MTGSGHTARRSLGSRRGTLSLTVALLSALTCCLMSVPQASAAGVPVGQALVVLLHNKTAHTAPSTHARPMAIVASRRPLTGAQTVLPVLRRARSKHGRSWVDVRLPGRPNGSAGWITTDGTMPSWTPWRLSVSLHARLVTVYHRGRVIRRYSAVVGKPSTPTPQGSFFIEEGLTLGSQAAGGPYALATSDRSNVLQEFDGGPGQIALHGMDNLAGALGTASSHGCIRLATSAISWLARRIGAGVPLRILP